MRLIINTRFDTDAAEALFRALGFTVTPRGYHTLGSINHAILFGGHHLELTGLPADGSATRPEIAASPLGADGLVYRTDDPQRTFEDLRAAGFEATPQQHFSQPVEGFGDARFVTVRLAASQLPGGRVYFCQHLTPEFVFRETWRDHVNGSYALAALHLVDVERKGKATGGLASLRPAPTSSLTAGRRSTRISARWPRTSHLARCVTARSRSARRTGAQSPSRRSSSCGMLKST
ncbi:VOC family protein [Paraburkholderia silvatlantica]|uniref:VOC family protein n=1 Tax=Paraburkholderia silvatlantica TaxID=321895 RepID=UPI00105E598F|nr:VOC family protein [Paraburkholderia silvatlantica]TDQ98501.1 glyoxalase-like protein [Paraburkholderia silvatlantica]